MNLTQKRSLILIGALALICIFLGTNLYLKSNEIKELSGNYDQLALSKEQVIFDLEKMRFSYDTLKTENELMLAEIAAQKDKIDGLITKVKNGNRALAKAKKESETLRTIMKGYIVTIDSLNQLNLALTEENIAMKERVEEVQVRNDQLVQRQENMEEIIAAGRQLQTTEVNATGIRLTSSGRQREVTRSNKTDMIKVCFTLLENAIAKAGNKNINLKVFSPDGNLLYSEDGDDVYSAKREVDYSKDRLTTCMFFTVSEEARLVPGMYDLEIYEEDVVIGTTQLDLR